MLRDLKDGYLGSLFLSSTATVAGGSVSSNPIGFSEFSSTSSPATGKFTANLKKPFARVPIVLASRAIADVAANGGAYVDGDPAVGTITVGAHSGGSGSGDDGTVSALVLGYLNTNTTRYGANKFDVKGAFDVPRMIGFKVTTTTPTINIGNNQATIAKNATGDVTLTFKIPFQKTPVAIASPILGTRAEIACVCTTTTCRVLRTVSGSGTDGAFYLIVYGTDLNDITQGMRVPIRVPQRKPRIVAGRIAYSAGTPSLEVNPGAGTLVDTGTGDVALTFTNAFSREPICVVTPSTATLTTIKAAASITAVSFTHFDAGGSAADPSDLHFLCLGYDDATEY